MSSSRRRRESSMSPDLYQMNMRFMKSAIFSIWIVAIATLSVMPYSKNGAASLKLTDSGMVVHFVTYFVGTALFYWAFIKGPQITQIARIRKNTLFSILIPSLTIFLFSVALEIVQFYLPYRTFNPVDIAANASGIVFFVVVWAIFWRRRPGMDGPLWGDD